MSSLHFTDNELKCPCCGLNRMDARLLQMADTLREMLNRPLIVHSAMRCEAHNRAVGGASNSAHLFGMAMDIRAMSGTERWQLIFTAKMVGFKRIGVGNTFIHVDNDEHLPQFVIWTY